jgi:acetyltransferase
MSASRAFARTKPIVAYKAGRFAESAQAAASHTGAMAGEDGIYDAAFERAGIVRVYDIDDMFECAELIARRRIPRGPRLAIVTNAGGPGVMATDTLVARSGVLAELSGDTIAQLDERLPAFWSRGNPVDVLGDAPPDRIAGAMEVVLADPGVDAAIVVLAPQAMTKATDTARAVSRVFERFSKPVLAAWMGAGAVAVRAFMYLVDFSRNIEMLYETPRDMPVSFALDRTKLRSLFDTMLLSGGEMLSETASKAMLDAYEIPTTGAAPARSADEAVHTARRIGYPVVLKVLSPDISHKTDVGGVQLDLRDDDEVRRAYDRLVARAAAACPEAAIEGVTVQEMADATDGHELILGAKKDAVFGTVIMVGSGGVTAELYKDRALGLPPLNERLARRMLESLRCWPVLQGYRGRPPLPVDRVIEILMRLSYLVADYPEIEELDVNPLLVTPGRVVALDARLRIARRRDEASRTPFAHLAIPPYPVHYVRTSRLRDGTPVTLRPIKPEDVPMWHAMLAACSPESIRERFSHLIKATTHAMAARYCFNDYDREMAIVGEIEEDAARKLIGVGRLVADPDHDAAEYAVLVPDRWQNQGVGRQLTEYCLEIAEDWRLNRVTAITSPANHRMVKIFRELGFEVESDPRENLVVVNRILREPAST